MKKLTLIITLAVSACINCMFVNVSAAKTTATRQSRIQPFCKFTFVDHRGHSIKLSTNILHATSKSLTFIFETGQKLIISFTTLRPGHFVAESARSKDPSILFFSQHGVPVSMTGAVIITTVKPAITGNFSHLVSDDDEHITLVSGTFNL
ncbi:MAG: hypothetical protein ABIN91_06625 [Mucilaginibacter sp.]|uniref:hypothetical protein n=1 Tax=Mucilaginibacter sp. TaxID=1882438 RepID=UPI0032672311